MILNSNPGFPPPEISYTIATRLKLTRLEILFPPKMAPSMCYITFGHYSKQNAADDILRKEFPGN